MVVSDDFSTNQSLSVAHPTTDDIDLAAPHPTSSSTAKQPPVPVYHRHHLSFDDGNLALLADDRYFIIHQGLLCRHSQVLQGMLVELKDTRRLFDRPVLELDEKWTDLGCFLAALYDGVYGPFLFYPEYCGLMERHVVPSSPPLLKTGL